MTCVSFTRVFLGGSCRSRNKSPHVTRQVTCGKDSGDRNQWKETGLFKVDLEQLDRETFLNFLSQGFQTQRTSR